VVSAYIWGVCWSLLSGVQWFYGSPCDREHVGFVTNSNEFQFFWSEGPLNWISQLGLRSFTRFSDITVHVYSYDRGLNPDIQGCICLDANEYLPREIYERVKTSFGGKYGEGSGYSRAADLFRYKLLYEKGGWYFDTDCLLIKPLTPLFDRDHVFGWASATVVGNAVLKFPKGDAMLDELYKGCVQKSPAEVSVPGTVSLFTQYLKKFNLIDRALPRDYFYAMNGLWSKQEQRSFVLQESPYILHLYASTPPSTFELRRQIDALNKSLSLRIARKIPFGKQIRKFLVKGE